MAAAFLVPGAAGLWAEGADAGEIPRVTMGIISLGFVLFGVMYRPAIVAIGLGIAAAFYAPSYLAGDASEVVSAGSMLAVALLGAAWIHKSGSP